MPRTIGSSVEEAKIKYDTLVRLIKFWGARKNKATVSFSDLACALTGLNPKYISDLKSRFLKTGQLIPKSIENKQNNSPRTDPLTTHVQEVLVNRTHDTSVNELVDTVNQKLPDDEHLSKQQCYHILRALNFSSKAASTVLEIDSAEAEEKRTKALKVFLSRAKNVGTYNEYVFVDECSLTLGELREHQRLISGVGTRAFASTRTNEPDAGVRLTAIVFISISEAVYVVTTTKNVNAEIFDDILRRFLHQTSSENLHLLLGDAKVHSKALLDNLIEEREGFSYSFLPPYSPDTNAAEPVHHMLKTALRDALVRMSWDDQNTLYSTATSTIKDFQVRPEVRHRLVLNALRTLSLLLQLSYKEATKQVQHRRGKRHDV